MSYHHVLNLEREPFSTSPDPSFLYLSEVHRTTLLRTEIAIRLKRGLSVIYGDIGTGKTTLSRKLFQSFAEEENVIFHMLLDPSHKTELQFLLSIARNMGIDTKTRSIVLLKELVEKYLFKKGVSQGKTVVLVIDEAQKLSLDCLEILRVLLNYETNEFKLLQVVLLGQLELLPKMKKLPNFLDRICLKQFISPLSEEDTKNMINFRLKKANYCEKQPLFTPEAIKEIYTQSGGYPRKVIFLCHNALEYIIMQEKNMVDESVVREIVSREANVLAC